MTAIEQLYQVMARLRDPQDGCPWDLKQTWLTILPSTLEEAYEVADAIERGHFDAVREELGDLLFQVVFYARLAEEEGRFSLQDVVDELTAKLIRRHPHVFPDGTLASRRGDRALDEAQIWKTWEAIKQEERTAKGQGDLFDDVPSNLPALSRAYKLQKRAANFGFDWPNVEPVFDKVREELAELAQEMEAGDRDAMERELGDLLFSVVNLGRHLKLDAETALRRCGQRFEHRIGYMRKILAETGETLDEATPERLERAWQQAKMELARAAG